jgi:hypothetical protein
MKENEMSDAKDRPLTIIEFKAWIEGVEQMQPSDWVPNDVQWKIIRERMEKLCNDLIKLDEKPKQPVPIGPVHRDLGHVQPSTINAFPSIPTPFVTTTTLVENNDAPRSSTLMGGPVDSGSPVIKTPHINTSNSQYKSQFD